MKLEDMIADEYFYDNEEILKLMQYKTPLGIIVKEDEEIVFQFKEVDVVFFHEQNCCEDVHIDDINGDFQDLIGVPLTVIEERTSLGDVNDYQSFTWTFYTFRSIKGSVDVKWYGTSNGYYSERVNIRITEPTFEEVSDD